MTNAIQLPSADAVFLCGDCLLSSRTDEHPKTDPKTYLLSEFLDHMVSPNHLLLLPALPRTVYGAPRGN